MFMYGGGGSGGGDFAGRRRVELGIGVDEAYGMGVWGAIVVKHERELFRKTAAGVRRRHLCVCVCVGVCGGVRG